MITLRHCPTDKMIADFFTKPLQGKHFKIMRDIILGITPFAMEERVGTNVNLTGKSIADRCSRTDGYVATDEPESVLQKCTSVQKRNVKNKAENDRPFSFDRE